MPAKTMRFMPIACQGVKPTLTIDTPVTSAHGTRSDGERQKGEKNPSRAPAQEQVVGEVVHGSGVMKSDHARLH